MKKLKKIIINLPQDKLKKFRAWYEKFDADAWDQQIKKDASAGKLNALANVAIGDHLAGKTKRL